MARRFKIRDMGQAVRLDGSTQYLHITDAAQAGIDFGLSDFMIGGFFRIRDDGALQMMFGKYSGASYANNDGGHGIELIYRGDLASKDIYFRVNNGTGTGVTCNCGLDNGYHNIGDGKWHHVMIVVDRGENKAYLYVDGVDRSEGGDGEWITSESGSWTNTGDLVLGAQSGTLVGGNKMTGEIDEFCYFDFGVGGLPSNIDEIISDIYYKGYYDKDYCVSLWKFDEDATDEYASNDLTGVGTPTYTEDVKTKPRSNTEYTRLIIDEGIELDPLDSLTGWTKGDTPASWDLAVDEETGGLAFNTGSANTAAITKQDLNLDLSKLKTIAMTLKVDDKTKSNGFVIYLSNDNGSFTNYVQFVFWNEDRFVDGEMYKFIAAKGDPTITHTEYGVFSWDSPIQTIRIRGYAQAGEEVNYVIKDLVYNFRAKPKILVMFDDGHESVYDTAKPILDTNNILTTQAIIAVRPREEVEYYMTATEITEMFNDGHDIANHSDDHDHLATLTKYEQKKTITDCDNYLKSQGWHRKHKLMVYPYGEYNDETIEVVKEMGFAMGRSTASELNYKAHPRFIGDDQFIWWCMSINSDTDTAQDVIDAIDAAVMRGGVISPLFHRIVAVPSISTEFATADFTTVIEYIAALRDAGIAEVQTFNEYYEDLINMRYKASGRAAASGRTSVTIQATQ